MTNTKKTKDTKIATFFIGDLVKLKRIDGPFMLVEEISRDKITTCWFEDRILHKGTFNIRNLQNYTCI